MVFSEPYSRNPKPRIKLFCPSCWHILKLKGRSFYPILLQQMKPGPCHGTILNLTRRKYPENIRQCTSSWSLSSGSVKEWLFWIWYREERQSTLTPTSGCLQNSGSVSNEFTLSTIQQKSCFSMTMQYRTQVWRHEKPSQNLIGQHYLIHSTAQWYRQGIHTLVPRWCNAIEVDGDFVEK
jgi:hypothetical protein